MPLLKFANQGTGVDKFNASLVALFPELTTDFERTTYSFTTELSAPFPGVACVFGFEAHLVAPMPAVLMTTQDGFSAEIEAIRPSLDSEFFANDVFSASLVSPLPIISTINNFEANIACIAPRVSSFFIQEQYFTSSLSAFSPRVNTSLVVDAIDESFDSDIVAKFPTVAVAFYQEGQFSAAITSLFPEIQTPVGFHTDLICAVPVVDVDFQQQKTFSATLTAPMAAQSSEFKAQQWFLINKTMIMPIARSSFIPDKPVFSVTANGFVPHVDTLFIGGDSFDYGDEVDNILQYDSARLEI